MQQLSPVEKDTLFRTSSDTAAIARANRFDKKLKDKMDRNAAASSLEGSPRLLALDDGSSGSQQPSVSIPTESTSTLVDSEESADGMELAVLNSELERFVMCEHVCRLCSGNDVTKQHPPDTPQTVTSWFYREDRPTVCDAAQPTLERSGLKCLSSCGVDAGHASTYGLSVALCKELSRDFSNDAESFSRLMQWTASDKGTVPEHVEYDVPCPMEMCMMDAHPCMVSCYSAFKESLAKIVKHELNNPTVVGRSIAAAEVLLKFTASWLECDGDGATGQGQCGPGELWVHVRPNDILCLSLEVDGMVVQ